MGLTIGVNCVLNRNTGSWGTPTWDPCANMREVTLNTEMEEADTTTRGHGKFKTGVPTLCSVRVVGQMNWDYADTDFAAFNGAFRNRTVIDCQVFDDGGKGIRGEFHVFKFPRAEPLNAQASVDFELGLAYSANVPTWV